MSDSADLLCFDCTFGLELGWFWNTAVPRHIFLPGYRLAESMQHSRALWRMLSEHAGHDLRLLGEQSREWDLYDDGFVVVGGDRTLGWDPSVAEYVGDWPGSVDAVLEPAYVVCVDDSVAFALGGPFPGLGERNDVLWQMLADHVYHTVRVPRRMPDGYAVVSAGKG